MRSGRAGTRDGGRGAGEREGMGVGSFQQLLILLTVSLDVTSGRKKEGR